MSASKTTDILNAINTIGGAVSIAIPIAGVLVPLATGIVAMIKKHVDAAGTVTYTVIIQMGEDELNQDIQAGEADLATINAQLVAMGLPTLTTGTGSPTI